MLTVSGEDPGELIEVRVPKSDRRPGSPHIAHRCVVVRIGSLVLCGLLASPPLLLSNVCLSAEIVIVNAKLHEHRVSL